MRIKQLNRALLFVNPNTGATIRMPIVKSQKEILESFRANRPEPEKVPYSVVKIKKKTKNT